MKVPQDTATSRLANRDKSGIIVLKSKDLPNGLSIRGKANSIVDKIDDTGVVLQSRKYDTDGKAIVDFVLRITTGQIYIPQVRTSTYLTIHSKNREDLGLI